MSWNPSPQAPFEAGSTSSLWRTTQLVLAALLAAILPPISIETLRQAPARLHKRLANSKRKRKQAVIYPRFQVS
jgi:hypothetical protein